MNPRIPIYKGSSTLLYTPLAAAALAGVIVAFFGPARTAETPAPAVVQTVDVDGSTGE